MTILSEYKINGALRLNAKPKNVSLTDGIVLISLLPSEHSWMLHTGAVGSFRNLPYETIGISHNVQGQVLEFAIEPLWWEAQ